MTNDENENLLPGEIGGSEVPVTPKHEWSDEERDFVDHGCADPLCPRCGAELGVICARAVHPDQPLPCGCEGTERMGMCVCDSFICQRCGYVATAREHASKTSSFQREVTMYLPPDMFKAG